MPPVFKNTGTAHYKQVIRDQQKVIDKLKAQLQSLTIEVIPAEINVLENAKYVYTRVERQKSFKSILKEMQSIIAICEGNNISLFKKDKLKKRLEYLDTLTSYKSVKPMLH